MKNSNNQLLFIQFLHPGKEHKPDNNNPNHISWNQDDHKRKFLKSTGIYLEGDYKIDSDIIFWGEWEAQSDVIKKLKVEHKNEPKYLYQPYYSILPNKNFLQNTDPFIFGNNFYYVCCRQINKRGFTQLRFLEPGSVILFGSCLNKTFVLDTVFVIRDYYNIESLAQISKYVPKTYVDVTLKHILSQKNNGCVRNIKDNCTSSQNFRLYIGATFDNPVNKMFSFFPCLPYQQNINSGFSRPIIKIPSIISDRLNQDYKLNSNQDHQQLWHQVRQQVEQANLKLGIDTEIPPHQH